MSPVNLFISNEIYVDYLLCFVILSNFFLLTVVNNVVNLGHQWFGF